MPETSQSRTIADLQPGEAAVIDRILDDELALKLLEMGCLPGEPVVLQHVAPLGDPVCIRVSGYSLSLRRSEAALICLVVAVAQAGPAAGQIQAAAH